MLVGACVNRMLGITHGVMTGTILSPDKLLTSISALLLQKNEFMWIHCLKVEYIFTRSARV